MDQANILIIGGGVIGCAIARSCFRALAGPFSCRAISEAGHGYEHAQ